MIQKSPKQQRTQKYWSLHCTQKYNSVFLEDLIGDLNIATEF